MTKDIRVIISADSTNAEKALDRVDKALGQLGQQTQTSGSAAPGFRRLGTDVRAVGDQSRYAREQMRNLSYQMTDIVTGLATGQNPFFVLLQQGGQLRDVFGGVVPALRAVASVFTITRVLAGGVAGAIAAIAVAAVKASSETDTLNKALARTGNAAQVTRGQFEQAVGAISDQTRVGAGDVRDLGLALVATGQLSAEAFRPALGAVSAFAKATGQATEDVSKEFAGLTGDTARWALDFARKYRAIDSATIELIKSLQAQGRQMEAIQVASEAVAESMSGRQTKSLYAVVRGWDDLTAAVGKYWDKLKGVFRDETPEGRLEKLLENQRQREAARAAGLSPNAGLFRDEEREKAQIKALQMLLGTQRKAREQAADFEAKDAKDRERNTSEYQGTLAANERAGAELRLAQQQASLEDARRIYTQAFQRGTVDAEGYQAALLQIDLAGIAAREQAAKAAAAAELSVKPSTPRETEAQLARQIQLKRELTELEADRQRLLEDERSGKRTISAEPTDALREQLANLTKLSDDYEMNRWRRAQDNAQRLVETNKDLAVDLIINDQQRVAAQLALEERRLREELDLTVLTAEQKKKVEEDLERWRVMRSKQLNDQIKPAYQRQLEQWQDVNLLMRQASEETWGGVLRNAEDAFVQLVSTGKGSLNALVQAFVAAQARMVFRKFAADIFGGPSSAGGTSISFSDVFGSVGKFFGMGGGRADGGDVHRGRLHPINERGVPEVLTVQGKDYLATGAASGKVTPMRSTSRSVNAVINQTNYIDSRSDAGQVAQIASQAVESGQRQLLDTLRAERVLG